MAQRKVHDRGGQTGPPINRLEHRKSAFEKQTDAMCWLLFRKRIVRVDEHRRAMEGMSKADYERLSYYQKWITALEALLLEKGIATQEEIDRAEAS